MVEWGVKHRNRKPVWLMYMYVSKQNENQYLVGYECVCPIDLKQNVKTERQKISRKEERKKGDFYNSFYRRRLSAEIDCIRMVTSSLSIT